MQETGWISFIINMMAHLSEHDGGRNETAEKHHIPPGWTWWGRPQHSLYHQYEVIICSEVLYSKIQYSAVVDTQVFFGLNIRVSQLIGRQLAQIGDQLDYKWREELPVQWPPLNLGIYLYAQTRRAFAGWVYLRMNLCFKMFWMKILDNMKGLGVV